MLKKMLKDNNYCFIDQPDSKKKKKRQDPKNSAFFFSFKMHRPCESSADYALRRKLKVLVSNWSSFLSSQSVMISVFQAMKTKLSMLLSLAVLNACTWT